MALGHGRRAQARRFVGVQQIAARDGTLCGLAEGGRVLCVDTGHCGPPLALTKPAKRPKAAKAAPTAEPVIALGFAAARQLAFDVGFCVITTTGGRLQCGDGCRKLDPIALERVDTMVGRCALLKSGTVTCFDGTKFVAVPGVQRAILLAVGRAHACALVGGAIVCWGDNARGQLGEFAVTP